MIMFTYNERTGFLILSLPLAYRLEKSDSVRLKRASPPLLSQDSRFLAVCSLKELTILLLSSRLLFFCRNPKYEEEESGGWKHFPNMMRAAAFPTITCTITSTSVFVFLQFISSFPLSLSLCPFSAFILNEKRLPFCPIHGRVGFDTSLGGWSQWHQHHTPARQKQMAVV